MPTVAEICVVMGLLAGSEGASPPKFRLRVEAAGEVRSCLSAGALRDLIAARLGADPFAEDATAELLITVGRTPRGYAASAELRDEQQALLGSRRLDWPHASCEGLLPGVALAVSIALEPVVTRRTPATAVPDPPVPEPPSAPPTPSPLTRSSPGEPSAAAPLGLLARLGAALDVGTTPSMGIPATFAPALGIELRWRALTLGLDGQVDFAGTIDDPAGGAITASTMRLILTGCALLSPIGRATPSLCGLVSFGALQGSSLGVVYPKSQSTPLVHGGGRVTVDLALMGPVSLRAHADLAANLTRTTLKLNERPLWSTPLLVGAVGLSLAVRIL